MSAAKVTLSCEACGEEMVILDDTDDRDFSVEIEEWDDQHEHCGEPSELAAWRRMVEHGDETTIIRHDGNAEKVSSPPRPSWAPRHRDLCETSVQNCTYRSELASVAARRMRGWDFPDRLLTSRVDVSAKLDGNGRPLVGLTIVKPETGEDVRTVRVGLTLTVAEARELAEVISAAADLAETP